MEQYVAGVILVALIMALAAAVVAAILEVDR